MRGIRTWADLKDRCRIDEERLCWLWAGGRSSNGQPCTWLPAIKRHVSLTAAIGYLKTGAMPAKGQLWYAACGHGDCCNPQHRRLGDKSHSMLACKLVRSPLTKARISRAKRATAPRKLTDEDVHTIQAEQPSVREIVERYGISRTYAYQVRSGRASRLRLDGAPNSSVWLMKA